MVELGIRLQIAPKILAWRFEVDVNYRLSSTRLDIKTNLVPIGYTQQSLPKTIPRVGWELAIPTAFEHCKWFGLGPGESYVDKREAARVGVYESEVSGLDYAHEVLKKM